MQLQNMRGLTLRHLAEALEFMGEDGLTNLAWATRTTSKLGEWRKIMEGRLTWVHEAQMDKGRDIGVLTLSSPMMPYGIIALKTH